MKTHHIITDGWSQALLGNRISETYLTLLQGRSQNWSSWTLFGPCE